MPVWDWPLTFAAWFLMTDETSGAAGKPSAWKRDVQEIKRLLVGARGMETNGNFNEPAGSGDLFPPLTKHCLSLERDVPARRIDSLRQETQAALWRGCRFVRCRQLDGFAKTQH